MRRYTITRNDEGAVRAMVNGYDLPPCHYIRNHSPTGFEYGFGGSGPAQLSLALLVDHFTHAPATDIAEAHAAAKSAETAAELAQRFYQRFKAHVVAAVPQETKRWTLNTPEISSSLRTIYAALRAA